MGHIFRDFRAIGYFRNAVVPPLPRRYLLSMGIARLKKMPAWKGAGTKPHPSLCFRSATRAWPDFWQGHLATTAWFRRGGRRQFLLRN